MDTTMGERLRRLRLHFGATQKEIAKNIGISNVTYSQYERDERVPNDEIKTKLANLFYVSVDYLINGDDTPERDKFIALLIQRTLEKKLEWVDVDYETEYEHDGNLLDTEKLLDMIAFYIPSDVKLNKDYRLKVTSINENIIFFYFQKSYVLQALVYGAKNCMNIIEDSGNNDLLLGELALILFDPDSYNKKNKLNTLIDDLRKL